MNEERGERGEGGVIALNQALFIASDINGDGELDYSEFIDMAGLGRSSNIRCII